MNIGIFGIAGRMGRSIFEILLERGHSLSRAIEYDGSEFLGLDAGTLIGQDEPIGTVVESVSASSLAGTDVCIDFSMPEAIYLVLEKAQSAGCALVVGTTGHDEKQKQAIKEASQRIPVLFSPNMSVGVNLLFKLTEITARALQDGYDMEVFEAHHRFKKDAPSGTARHLIDILKANVDRLADAEEKHGREGIVGQRKDNEIGVMCMRGGDIVGDHTVFFTGMGERLELTHRATNREILSRGAVRAAEFMYQKKNGLYSMFDVLGLE